MSPELIWEILSNLTNSGTDDSNPRPFYSQRNSAKSTQRHSFIYASPIYDGPAIFSFDQIQQEFVHVLQSYSIGKMSVAEIAGCLGLDEDKVLFVGDHLCEKQDILKVEGGYAMKQRIMEELAHAIDLHGSFSDEQSIEVHLTLEAVAEQHRISDKSFSSGGVSAQQLSDELGLGLDDFTPLLYELFQQRSDRGLEQNPVLVIDDTTGQPSEVANLRTSELKKQYFDSQVLSVLRGITIPTSVESLFPDISRQNLSIICSIIENLCNTGKIQGTLDHLIYTPTIYSIAQRKSVDSFFSANGYLTETKCIGFGVPKNRMEQFVRESFPNSILLKHSIINANQLCPPLEDALQTSLLNQSFTDLKALVPEEISSCQEDLTMLVRDVFMDLLKYHDDNIYIEYSKGVAVVQGGIAMFFSDPMIEKAKKLVPSLIEGFAKCKAKDIMRSQQEWNYSADECTIPLFDVAKLIAQAFPDLVDAQKHHDMTNNQSSILQTNEMSWVPENATNDGPLIEFCRHALDTKVLNNMCLRAIKAEINAIQHAVNASSMLLGAAKVQNTEDAFEASFRDMCYLLQLFVKGIDALECKMQSRHDIESKTVAKMKSELLLTCASCLAKRVTEYCIFKYNITEEQKDVLIFECTTTGIPNREHGFCIPVDFGSLVFPSISLNCKPDGNGKVTEPHLYLKSLFPHGVAVNIAKMWSLCSNDDTPESNNQHNLANFIDLLSETCLSLVGIPFSILDKKNEKRLLSSRRQCIVDQLKCSNEKKEILLSVVVFLFQLSRNISVIGERTIQYVLDHVLSEDKKISQGVLDTLFKLKDDDATDDLVKTVKQFGAAKNTKALAAMSK